MQLSYAIGYPDPINIWVNTNGTAAHGLTDEQIAELIRKHFKLTPQRHHRDAEPAPADLPRDGPPRPLRPRAAELHLGEDRQGRGAAERSRRRGRGVGVSRIAVIQLKGDTP